MTVFKATYKARDGSTQRTRKWYVELRDHLSITRRFSAFSDKAQSEALGRQIGRLVNYKVTGEQPDVQLSRWLEGVSEKLRDRFVKIGLLDAQRTASLKSLSKHPEDFKQSLLKKGTMEKHANLTHNRASNVIRDCKFARWGDISASHVQAFLADLRQPGMSARTYNGCLQAVKQFCRFMVQDWQTSESPLRHLKKTDERVDQRHPRRSLEPDEMRRLLEAAQAAGKRFGMTGYARALLYRFTAETGLRANEVRSLTVSSFDLQGRVVKVEAADCKSRGQKILPLRADTAKELKAFFAGKLPNVTAFDLLSRYNMAKMLKAHLADTEVCDAKGHVTKEAIP